MRRRVVVTGLGVLSPIGTSLQTSWANVLAGKSAISKLEGPLYQKLPCKVAGMIMENGAKFDLGNHFSKAELRSMSTATAYALLAAKEAVKDANWTSTTEEQRRVTGVAIGMGMVDLQDVCDANAALCKGYNRISPFFVPRILPNMAAGQISIKYNFRGPNHAVSTACATGAHAIGDSFYFIRNGDADVMICGGTEACISPLSIAAFCRLRALSTAFNEDPLKASRPFDKKRDGFVMGEGSAVLVLEELEHAISRGASIYAEILGYGLSGDASHLTAPSTDGSGAMLAMERAIKNAGIKPEQVGYVNAHATSTPMGDAIEIKAIKSVFKEHAVNVAVSSTKGAHGHLLGAAGNLEAVFAIKTVQEGLLPPTVNLEIPDDDMTVNLVAIKHQKWEKAGNRIALKNAFGFGGTNACLCIGQYNK